MSPSAPFRRTLLVVLLLLLAGCGEPQAPEPAPAPPLPDVPPVPPAAKAAHALERLERGPGRLGGLRIEHVHRRNLELATADLVFYESEAAKLISDPARIERITTDAARYGDAWHNILRLLIAFRARPEALVVAWTRPVLALPLDEAHHTLRLEAVRLLGLVDGPETGAVLLALFEQSPQDREIGIHALVSLARRPALRDRAYEIALRHGTASLWESAPTRVAAGMPQGEVDAGIAGAVAWWHALTAGSGPGMDTLLPKLKSPPWTQARLGVDPSVPAPIQAPDGSPRLRYVALDSHVAYGSGWFPSLLANTPERPVQAELLTGKLPAGEARCLLASWGSAGYRHAVVADLALEGIDDGLYYAAKHCMLDVDPASDAEAVQKIALELALSGAWTPERVRRLQRLVASIASCDRDDVWNVLVRVLREVRPLDVGRPVIEQAYDIMYQREDDVRALLAAMLESGDDADAGVALHLIRRARDPDYLDILEAHYDRTTDEALRGVLRRTLTFIYSAAIGVEPARYRAFVQRYRDWLAEADDARFRTMAAALLDFGDAGARAFAEGLTGPRRDLYVQAWPRDRRLVPRIVAEAAVAPLDRRTPPVELNHVLGLAWSSFPVDAAPALEALRRRMPASARAPVEAALERVRHRAPRHGDA